MIAPARLRKGSTNSAKGAHRFVADTLITARSCGATGTLVLRADSAFYQSDVIAAALRRKACFSITARQLPPVRKAIESIAADAWTPIKYTNAIWDDEQQRWISGAEVAEIAFTAFTSKAKAKQVTARLIVRRLPDVNPANQNPLFTVYRYHAVFTNRLITAPIRGCPANWVVRSDREVPAVPVVPKGVASNDDQLDPDLRRALALVQLHGRAIAGRQACTAPCLIQLSTSSVGAVERLTSASARRRSRSSWSSLLATPFGITGTAGTSLSLLTTQLAGHPRIGAVINLLVNTAWWR